MDTDRAQRIYICLNEMVAILESIGQQTIILKDSDWNKIKKLQARQEYQEMKEWLKIK